MKRILTVVVSFVVMFSAITAGAQINFSLEIYSNYTGNYSFKMQFKSSDDLVELLDEVGAFYEEPMIIDLKPFLKSILSTDAQITAAFDMSEDMKVIKAAIEADSSHIVDVNSNLSADVAAKTGVWINMDFSDEENPVYELICSSPMMNKYLVTDVFEEVPEEEKEEFVDMINKFLNKEFVKSMGEFTAELINKYAKINASYGKCVIKVDNAALMNMIEDIIPFIIDKVASVIDMQNEGYEKAVSGIREVAENIDLSGITLLGDKGITCAYTLRNKKISAINETLDVCIDIAGIYETLSGEEWNFSSRGILEFEIISTGKISKIGATTVSFPNLTQENSINFSELYAPESYEEFSDYPHYFIYAFCDKLPVIEDDIYVPLRKTIEAAFEESAQVTYDNGVITLESEYFPGFKTLNLYYGSDKAYTELGEYVIDPIIIEDGVTYVNKKLFEEIFGWSFSGAIFNVLAGEYTFEFYADSNNYSDEEQIPAYWVAGSFDAMADFGNGEKYVPLRQTIEKAYGDFVQITYDNGVITLESEYFPGFTKLTLTSGESKAYTETGEFDIGAVIVENSVTYVNSKFFENVFGWEMASMQYDMLKKIWQYEFFCYNEA